MKFEIKCEDITTTVYLVEGDNSAKAAQNILDSDDPNLYPVIRRSRDSYITKITQIGDQYEYWRVD